MNEFVFKNLSVKLFPGDGSPDEQCGVCTQACTEFCSDGFTCESGGCPTFLGSNELSLLPKCPGGGTETLMDPGVIDVLPAEQYRAELAALKDNLRRTAASVEVRERAVAALPDDIDEVDRLRAQLVAALAQLDEQRARLEGSGPDAP